MSICLFSTSESLSDQLLKHQDQTPGPQHPYLGQRAGSRAHSPRSQPPRPGVSSHTTAPVQLGPPLERPFVPSPEPRTWRSGHKEAIVSSGASEGPLDKSWGGQVTNSGSQPSPASAPPFHSHNMAKTRLPFRAGVKMNDSKPANGAQTPPTPTPPASAFLSVANASLMAPEHLEMGAGDRHQHSPRQCLLSLLPLGPSSHPSHLTGWGN